MKTPFHIIHKKIIPYLAVIFLLTSCHAIENNSAPQENSAVSEIADPETVNLLPAPENREPASALSELQVHFIDVGQGDSTLIICGNESLLIDAGNNDKGTSIQLYLQKQGVDHLTYVIGTHPDADHIGGLDVILTKFDCGTVIMPEVASDTASYRDVMAAMDYRNYKNTLPQVGDVYVLGDAEFTVIAPNGDYADDNNCSVGIKLVHGKNSFLFTGDAGAEAEADILRNGIDIKADVLHAGHHGSSTSSSQDFINGVSPSYAVISCGKDNPYGHPHEQTLKTLRENGVQIFRTDEQDSIVAVSDGQSVSWSTEPSLNWIAGSAAGSDTFSVSNGQTEADASSPMSSSKPESSVSETVIPDTPALETDAITYVLNRNTHKFHEPDCKSVNDIRESNREDTTLSRDEILAAGYVPCKICNP
ncbi:MAG: MBL fold metallo-hydrolase [Blautia sp.]|nr:MBL fold metallo-hydrolase [Blautia sp.]